MVCHGIVGLLCVSQMFYLIARNGESVSNFERNNIEGNVHLVDQQIALAHARNDNLIHIFDINRNHYTRGTYIENLQCSSHIYRS